MMLKQRLLAAENNCQSGAQHKWDICATTLPRGSRILTQEAGELEGNWEVGSNLKEVRGRQMNENVQNNS